MARMATNGSSANMTVEPFNLAGDTYVFELASTHMGLSIDVAKHSSIQAMINQMRSPEVLWIQAFQRINQHPRPLVLTWSDADRRYHLSVMGLASEAERQELWANLTAVGFLPALVEQ